MLVRTYAPVGQPPILRVPLTRDHLSAIGGMTPAVRLFLQMQEQAYRAEDVVAFLRLCALTEYFSSEDALWFKK